MTVLDLIILDIMDCLLSRNDNMAKMKIEIEARNDKGRTPFHLACMYGQFEIAKLLIQMGGADPTVNKLL